MSQPIAPDNFYDEGYDDDERVCDNRIEFPKTRMYGREAELKSLHEIYDRICSNRSSTEVVLISGYSGTGKSSLVRRLAEEIKLKATKQKQKNSDSRKNSSETKEEGATSKPKRCFFLSGKFDDLQGADPFSAIVQAFSGFASELLQQSQKDNVEEEVNQLRQTIIEAIGSDGKILTDLIPSLSRVIYDDKKRGNEDSKESDESSYTGCSNLGIWSRLTYIFQKFVRAICAEDRSLLLFLDDLQWADTASLDLLTSLICDSSLQNFMLVGALRSNEVDIDHPLKKNFVRIVQQKRTIREMDLHNLSMQDINVFISDTLELTPEETMSLTRALYSKTRGNIFFTIQALEEWNRRNVIYHSAISFQWEWNLKEVELEGARLSEDVVGVVAAKIKRAPDLLQKALTIASYTRSTFDVDTLHSLLAVVGKKTIDRVELLRLLDTAVLEGLLTNEVGSEDYTFAHDRIQQAAYFLVPVRDDRDNLRKRIGVHMLERGFSNVGEDWMLFIAADHLNHSIDNSDNNSTNSLQQNSIDSFSYFDSLQLAKLNLEVGKKSMLVAAFNPASRYLRTAQKLLFETPDPWNRHYELTLRLLRAVMDVELALGNYETGHCLGQLVLDNARTTDDALPTYRTFALALARQERNREAVELCIIALDVLYEFPKRLYFLRAVRKIHVVKKLLKKHSDEDILSLPKMTDEKMLLATEFLYECSRQAFLCGNLFQSLFCLLQNIVLGFKHGLCSFHCHAYLGFGILMSEHFGEQEMGVRLSSLAKAILKKHNENKEIQSTFYLAICTCFDAWTLPVNEVLNIFRRGHISGMQGGDIDFGFRNWAFQIYYGYIFGFPLNIIEQASSEVLEQVLRYKIDCVSGILLEMMFLFRHLIGTKNRNNYALVDEEERKTNSNSEDENEEEDGLDWKKIKHYGIGKQDTVKDGDGMKLLQGLLSRLQLAVYFDELKVAEKLCQTASKIFKIDHQYHIITIRVFFAGLTALGLLRQHPRRKKYKTMAQKMVAEMKKACNKRGNNSYHRYLLMEADLKALTLNSSKKNKNGNSYISLYDKAITSAVEMGCVQDAALGNELAGRHFLGTGDNERAKKYFKQAQALYLDWGARKKVEHIQSKYGDLLVLTSDNDLGGGSTSQQAMIKTTRGNVTIGGNTHRKMAGFDLLSGI